jgi:hypothetical protein
MKKTVLAILFILSTNNATTVFAGFGTITGRLVISTGKPMSNGQVFFFHVNSLYEKPVMGKYWRVPDFAEKIDDSGKFTVELEEGSYYIGAIKRTLKEAIGPPQIGDYFLPSHDSKRKYRIIHVKAGKTTNIGTIGGIRRYSAEQARFIGSQTVISGRVTNQSGQPEKNMFVLAYTDPAMRGRPSFVSAASDESGGYSILVDKGRTFYLKVRALYAGGKPQVGSLVGVYGEFQDPTPVVVKTDSITDGIDIMVIPFSGGGPQQ